MRSRLLPWLTFGLCVVLGGARHAAPTVYTSYAAFLAALPGASTVVNFDGLASGTVIASGSASSGGGASLLVTNGSAAGGGGPYAAPSAPNCLGTSDFDALLDGDTLTLGVATANAIGLFVVSVEEPGDTIRDGDIGLTAHGATALLDVDAVHQTLPDGSLVYFLGVIDAQSSFSSASLDMFGGGEAFAYGIDGIVRVTGGVPVPLPGAVLMGVVSSFVLAALWLRWKRGGS